MAKNMEEIARILKDTRFRRCIFGGVDEDEVWAQLERMNKEYTELLEARRQRAKGAVGSLREYALKLEVEIREKDEQLRLLTESRKMPKRTEIPENKPNILPEDVFAFCSIAAGKGAWPRQASPIRPICSAEQIRRMYAGKSTTLVSRYG